MVEWIRRLCFATVGAKAEEKAGVAGSGGGVGGARMASNVSGTMVEEGDGEAWRDQASSANTCEKRRRGEASCAEKLRRGEASYYKHLALVAVARKACSVAGAEAAVTGAQRSGQSRDERDGCSAHG